MYKCEECGAVSLACDSEEKVVLELRSKEYPSRSYSVRGEDKVDKGGWGFEIVKEKRVCRACKSILDASLADVKQRVYDEIAAKRKALADAAQYTDDESEDEAA